MKKDKVLGESVSKDLSVATIIQKSKGYELSEQVGYLTHYIGDDMYVQVFVPIPHGHAEVIYEVPKDVYQIMKQTLIESIFIAILSVLLTAMILYPLVKRLVRNIQKNEQDILQSNVDMLSSWQKRFSFLKQIAGS